MAGTRNFDNIETGNPDQTLELVEDPNQETDGTTDGETSFQNTNWTKYNGFYREYQIIQAVIDKMALWTVGKGFKADKKTEKTLENIRGFGKDTINNILENMIRIYLINGDSYAEIIRDKSGKLINLKPLNPGKMKIIANSKGIITRYELTGKGEDEPFKPEKIFHLCWNREADEIHGISILEAINDTLKKGKQLDEDMEKVFHRYVMPLLKWSLDTDDEIEIAKMKVLGDKAVNEGRGIYIPKGAVEVDAITIPQFSTLDPLKWKQEWNQEIIASVGVPELVLGRATDITKASAKMVYLEFQQTIERNQRFVEAQIKAQLELEIELEFPARIEENLGEDEGKDGAINTGKKSEVSIKTEKVGGNNAAPV